MVRGRFNHPSIVMWILFNEGWGLPLKDRKERPRARSRPRRSQSRASCGWSTAVREEDPTRLINAESGAGGGGNDHGEDSVGFRLRRRDRLSLLWPRRAEGRESTGPAIVGEYGWGLAPVAALRARLESSKGDDISGCVVTQLTDVENEHNGALKYDRTVVRNVELDKEIPGGILRVLHEYGYHDYPGGPATCAIDVARC